MMSLWRDIGLFECVIAQRLIDSIDGLMLHIQLEDTQLR